MKRIVLLLLAGAVLSAARTPIPKQVLAFYYGWYGNPEFGEKWNHWEKVDPAKKTIVNSTHYPALGAYDSHDPKLIEQHCREARNAGITGFIVSWWASGDYHDRGLPLLLDIAERHNLTVTVYFETVRPREKPDPKLALEDVLYLLRRYGSHPAWLKVNSHPVIFVYGRAVGQIKPEGWAQVIEGARRNYPPGAAFIGDRINEQAARVFDGIHTYNPTGQTAGKSVTELRAWAKAKYPEWVKTAGDKISCLTVIPGYDDTKLGRPAPRPTTDRHQGKTYGILWEEAIAAKPNWILITSWNEWHEGSEIEPSHENGGRELKNTARFAKRFLRR